VQFDREAVNAVVDKHAEEEEARLKEAAKAEAEAKAAEKAAEQAELEAKQKAVEEAHKANG
jgi:hypothetical protein